MDRRRFLLTSLAGAGALAAPILAAAPPVLAQGVYVYVLGEVRRPAAVKHTRGMTVGRAIAQAGGFTRTASPRDIYLTRGGETWKVNLTDILVYPTIDPEVQPGDIIQVGQRLI
jgi:protein involved in polysaccharide export with SLBB domain